VVGGIVNLILSTYIPIIHVMNPTVMCGGPFARYAGVATNLGQELEIEVADEPGPPLRRHVHDERTAARFEAFRKWVGLHDRSRSRTSESSEKDGQTPAMRDSSSHRVRPPSGTTIIADAVEIRVQRFAAPARQQGTRRSHARKENVS
jgi:hypothetical protein